MTQPITHKCPRTMLTETSCLLSSSTKNGLKCDWRGNCIYSSVEKCFTGFKLSWDFDWSVLKLSGVDGLSGHITVPPSKGYFAPRVKIDVELTESTQKIEKIISIMSFHDFPYISFEYSLIPHRSTGCYDEMFRPSERTDAILVIDGKKLHVNKGFLSFHSEHLRLLFSSNFKKGQMDEIQINDISYGDFGLLMSTIYPQAQYPNDETVEKLLELADRFRIPAVIGHVEHHLLHHSIINNEKKIWMADAFGMPKLLEKCFQELNSVEKVKKLKASPEFKKLSKDAKLSFFEHAMKFIR